MDGITKVSPGKPVRSLPSDYSSCLLYEKNAEEILHGLKLAMCNPGQSNNEHHSDSSNDLISEPVNMQPEKLVVSDAMSCGCCQLTFDDRDDQKSHFKSDWHRYNIQRKVIGQPPIDEEKFEEIAGDVSSISGSDEDEDRRDALGDVTEETVDQESGFSPVNDRKLHKVYFTNGKEELISLYRCLLHHKKDPPEDINQLVTSATQLPKQNKYAVILISAGHFAGAIFHGKDVIEHKTFHRYTIRAKRGTAQSSRDQKSNAPNSAGARLRRYNEEALSKEVQELLEIWKDHLKTCNLIFVRIPVNNRAIFYGGKNPILKKEDSRIRIIPFSTRRPTFGEAKRVYQMLVSIECYGQNVDIGSIAPLSPPRFYSQETEKLEVREPRIKLPKKKEVGKISDFGSRRLSVSPYQAKQVSEDSSDAEVDVQLVESIETIDLTHLQEFEATKRKHKKKKKPNQKDTEKDKNSELDEDKLRWRNKLFTCCKTGDVQALLSTLLTIKALQEDSYKSQTKKNSVLCEQKVNIPPGQLSGATCQDQSTISDPDNISAGDVGISGGITVVDESSSSSVSDIHSKTNQETSHLADNSSVPESNKGVPGSSCVSEKNATLSNPHPTSDLLTSLLNSPVGDSKTTFLHLASREGHAEVIRALLTHGADPAIKDGSGKLAYNLGQTEVRNIFRRFMAEFPDKYNYVKAQVPSPLTPEMENEKKMKMAEKRKQKKKAANERNKIGGICPCQLIRKWSQLTLSLSQELVTA